MKDGNDQFCCEYKLLLILLTLQRDIIRFGKHLKELEVTRTYLVNLVEIRS